MEQIVLIYPNGTLYPLKRLYPVTSIEKAEQTKELLGRDDILISIETSEKLELPLGTKIVFAGEEYYLNVVPKAEKLSNRGFAYDYLFEAAYYDLGRAVFLDVDATGFYRGSEFDLVGNLALFAGIVVNAANNHFGGGKWVLGEVDDTEVKTLSFTNVSCQAGLIQICKEFEVEFRVNNLGNGVRQLNVKRLGELTGYSFEYGYKKGANNLVRTSVNDSRLVNRLYPYGSTENLPFGYRNFSNRLRIGDAKNDFIDANDSIAKFGPYAAQKNFDDIKPQRVGTVTTVYNNDLFSFHDESMDFNLTEKVGENTTYLQADKSAKIIFQTGNLAGKTYELKKDGYNHATKKFTIIPVTDANGLVTPGVAPFQIALGDKYIIVDINMPASYVIAAEAELRTKAQIYLDLNKNPMVQYGLTVDPEYIKSLAGEGNVSTIFLPGDMVQVKDSDLAIDKAIRIVRLTRNVISPYEYVLQLADSFDVNYIDRNLSDQRDIKTIIRVNDLRNANRAKAAERLRQELIGLVFDQEGNYFTEKIKPLSIETNMLSVGAKSQQFILNIVIEPNYGGQQNVVRVNAGQLIHYTIEPTIKTWNINESSVALGTNEAYYIYGRCSKTTGSATLLFSRSQITVDSDGQFYHFLIGVLHSVDPVFRVRWISLTYGATTINGRFIKTGMIESAVNGTYFDLDAGEIGGNITFRLLDGTKKNVVDLYKEQKDFATLVTAQLGQGDGLVETWFYPGVPTLANQPALNWNTIPLKDEHLNDLYYDTGTNKSYRFTKTGGNYSWSPVSDSDIQTALALAAAAKDTADGKRRVFVVQPYPPYDVGDLWTNGQDLRVCIVQRASGSYQPLDWDSATTYDNTVTTINGGIVTSGRIQLAGVGGSILAGISGEGTADTSVRFWAGASFGNRDSAPFRVLQSGEVFARKRIELMNSSNVGQAGICGANTTGDGDVRFWAGTDYNNRNSAPFRVLSNGSIIANAGYIGNWEINGGGIVNLFGSAYIIAASGTGSNVTKAVIGSNAVSAASGVTAAALFSSRQVGANNIGAIFEAANGSSNFAFMALSGKALINESLINGTSFYSSTNTALTDYVDPSLYDTIIINGIKPGSIIPAVTFVSPSRPIGNGKKIVIYQINPSYPLRLYNILKDRPNYDINGRTAIQIFYADGFWEILSVWNN